MSLSKKSLLLNAVTATGADETLILPNGMKDHTVQVSFSNSGGSCTALVVQLEGSLDGGTTWIVIDTSYTFSATDLSNGYAMFHVVDAPLPLVRLNVVTLTDTGTTTINGHYFGMRG